MILNVDLILLNFLFIIDSFETPGDDVDSDGSELVSISKISSTTILPTQLERSQNIRKNRYQSISYFI